MESHNPIGMDEEDERTFAGDLREKSFPNQRDDLEWEMEELDTVSNKTGASSHHSSPHLGPAEPSQTEKHTAPGMLPFSSEPPPRPRDSQEMTVSLKGSSPSSADEEDFEIEQTLNHRASPLPKSSLRDTTPRSPKSAEHTFAQASPLTEEIEARKEEVRLYGPTEEIQKEVLMQGLTVPSVPSAAPTLEEKLPPIPPFHNASLPQEVTQEETMHSLHSSPLQDPILTKTEKQDVSIFQQDMAVGSARPEQETFRDEPMTAHAIARKPLPKPRLKPGFVFAEQLTLPGLWRRGLAAFLDLSLLLGVSFLCVRLLGPALTKSPPADLHPLDLLVFALEHYSQHVSFGIAAFSLLYILYSMVGLLLWRGSLGKSLLGLEVVDRSGKKLGFFGALVRSVAFIPSFFLGLVGVFWILMDSEYRGLYDRVAGSVVVRRQS
ncbi:MAG: RDD family protein [Myxococcales bacterium]|nr:RDD family protein [Myxococcales bacterium]MCB9644119.1 RDD family protein [Myxococcales bacterium]